MKKILLAILPVLFLLSCTAQDSEHYKILEVPAYEQAISSDEVTIIDVRSAAEYQSGHIENAQNINVNSADFKTQVKELDKSKPVYIYCRSGARSYKAGKILEEQGFQEIYDLQGGIISWKGPLIK